MPFSKLALRPGVNTQATPFQNAGGVSSSNLIRWKGGSQSNQPMLEKMGGWKRLFGAPCAGIVRALHAYEDLSLNNNLLIGTDAGAQLYENGGPYTFTFARKTSNSFATAVAPSAVGSTAATVTDTGHGASVGDTIKFIVTMTVGGVLIVGGSMFTVTSIVDVNRYTITLPSPATSTLPARIPNFTGTTGASAPVQVVLPGHGLSVGATFSVEAPTAIANSAPAVTLSGAYTVASVIDASSFTINQPATVNPTNPGNQWTVAENTGIVTIAYTGSPPSVPQNWFLDNFGERGLISFTNGPIYEFQPPAPSGVQPVASGIPTAPQINAGIFVGMPQAQIIAFGSEAVIGQGKQDPLLVRWCNVGDETNWTGGGVTQSQAGSLRLSRGSRIIGGIQAPQSSLLWTDVDIWTMAYVGPPTVYTFTVVGSGCGLISPKARAVQGRNTYWMGQRGFWVFGDNGVQPLPCDVWDQCFPLIDQANARKCFAASNSSFQEIMFFFPAIGGNGEPSAYVKFNTQNGLWDYGQLARTAWIDESVFGSALGADLNMRVQQHEQGFDDDTGAMRNVFMQTGYAALSDGDQFIFVDQLLPDMKWAGVGGSVSLTIFAADTPNDTLVMHGPYSITATTKMIPLRVRARMIAMRLDWAATPGFSARFGAPTARTAPAGRA